MSVAKAESAGTVGVNKRKAKLIIKGLALTPCAELCAPVLPRAGQARDILPAPCRHHNGFSPLIADEAQDRDLGGPDSEPPLVLLGRHRD